MLGVDAVELNLSGARKLAFVQQSEAAECGLACLAMIAGWHGYEIDLATLRRRFPISLKGTTLRQLIDVAAQLRLAGRAVRCEVSALATLRAPCILHWEFSHFVVLKKVSGSHVWILDPAVGERVVTLAEFSDSFTGVALEISPTDGFVKKDERRRLLMRDLWRWQPETRGALVRAIWLSLVIEFFVLLSPYYMQLVIDQAILKGDLDLLVALAIGFGTVVVLNTVASVLRALVVQFLGNVLAYEMGARLLRQLLKLPLEFFQKRSLGDLLQRFQSLGPIQQFIVTGGIVTIIDGVLGSLTLVMLLLYSMELGLLVLCVVLFYVALRLLVLQLAKRYSMDAMVAGAREQGQFLETIRAIQTIKASGGEARRETEWLNLFVRELNTGIRMGNLGISYGAVNGVLSGISDIVIVFIAAKQVIAGELTIGIVTAFLAYKGQFMGRVMSLADQFIQYKMLDVCLERVADIALTEPEQVLAADTPEVSELRGEFELQNVVFRYAPADKPVLNGLDLKIRPGEFIAIAGSSGEGKSTLIKVLVGLYTAESGQVLAEGRPISEMEIGSFRRRLGIVMQDDQLLTGSIAENIALFDRIQDIEQIKRCARLAQIDEEITALPMQYHSLIGELGTSLSAGQKQRVLLARALYRNPSVLILDEGTVNVGPDCESRIIQMLKTLAITRIVITHSPHVSQAADRVLLLENGRIVELMPLEASGSPTSDEKVAAQIGNLNSAAG